MTDIDEEIVLFKREILETITVARNLLKMPDLSFAIGYQYLRILYMDMAKDALLYRKYITHFYKDYKELIDIMALVDMRRDMLLFNPKDYFRNNQT